MAATALVALGGCGRLGLDAGAEATRHAKARPGDDQLALVLDGREITLGDLNRDMQEQFLEEFLRQPEDRQFEMREAAIREMVQRHVVEGEAAKKGIAPEALYDEVTAAAPAVTIEDVSTWYEQNEERLQGQPLQAIAPQIQQMLEQERKGEAWRAFLDPKLAALAWRMELAPPRVEVEATRLVRGPADARVTLITFSDYQCPYCIRSERVLAEVLAKYPKDVKLVHRHFPLDQIHPFARPAAEAVMCADEQGKTWEFHDAVFARDGRLDEQSFAEIGSAIGLDTKAFERCTRERRYRDFVEADAQAGQAAGVTGTPAFFVNGIPMKGARDLEGLSRVIDSELARLAGS